MNFYCANHSFEKANFIIAGVPYDGTSSFRPGSRFAPNAIREASYGIESYSPYLNKDLRDIKICDMQDIPLSFGDKEFNLHIIESFSYKFLKGRKKLLSIGGEHLITYPIIKSVYKKYKDLTVLHIDAHSDLIDSYRGEKLSHASVMRRVAEIIGFENLYQLGIRSLNKSDKFLPFRDKNMCLFDFSKAEEYLEIIGDRPLYVSLDLDVLDPSIFCGTGTPEPGGVTYKELVNLLQLLQHSNIVGADVVELSPHYDNSGVSSVTAASAVRELLLAMDLRS